MSHEMLAFAVGALGVAMIALLVAGSYWMQRRVRAGLQKRSAVAVIKQVEASSTLKAKEVAGGVQGHASPRRVAEQRRAVVPGLRGSSAAFKNPAGGTVKDMMNRSLGIHYFEMLKGTADLARVK
jgi:hypothetical protein